MALAGEPAAFQTGAAVDEVIEKVSRNIFASIETVASVSTLESFGGISDDYESSLRYTCVSSEVCAASFRYESPLDFLASKVSAGCQAGSSGSLASLPPLSTTWDSLPAFGATLSLDSLRECADEDVLEPTVDLLHWGIDALSRFGYRLDTVIGEMSAVEGDSAEEVATTAILWRATRLADGGHVLVKGVTSSGKLPAAVQQAMSNDFQVLRALRGEAVLVAEALLCTRFEAWLVFDCPAGSAVQALLDARAPSGLAAAAEVFVQLLQGLARLAPPASSCDDSSSEPQQPDACDGPTNLLVASSAGQACSLTASLAKQASRLQRKRCESADVWAAALSSYEKLWDSLPQDLQEQAAASVMKSDELASAMVPDGSSAALLGLFRQRQALDLRVRPSAAEMLRHPVLMRG